MISQPRAPGESPNAQQGKGTGAGTAASAPRCRRAPWLPAPRVCAVQAGETQPCRVPVCICHPPARCQLAPAARSSPSTSQEKRRRGSRILLKSVLRSAVPRCSEHAGSSLAQPALGARAELCPPVSVPTRKQRVPDGISAAPCPGASTAVCAPRPQLRSFGQPARCPNAFAPQGGTLEEPPGTLAKRDLIQNEPYPDTSAQVQSCSQHQAHPTRTNRSKTSPAFQPRRCWDPFLCAPTPGGSRCDGAMSHRLLAGSTQAVLSGAVLPVLPRRPQWGQGRRGGRHKGRARGQLQQQSSSDGTVGTQILRAGFGGTGHFSPRWLLLSSWLGSQRQQGPNTRLSEV